MVSTQWIISELNKTMYRSGILLKMSPCLKNLTTTFIIYIHIMFKYLHIHLLTWSILGLCTGYDLDGYIDVRPFQYLGEGAVLIARKFLNMDNIIPPDLYSSELLDYCLEIYSDLVPIHSWLLKMTERIQSN